MIGFIVICRADCKDNGDKGDYELATRQVFDWPSEAIEYMSGISESRDPIHIKINFSDLRFEKKTRPSSPSSMRFKKPIL